MEIGIQNTFWRYILLAVRVGLIPEGWNLKYVCTDLTTLTSVFVLWVVVAMETSFLIPC